MIKFDPKSVEEHQARYTNAIAYAYDIESVSLGTAARAADSPGNHFDFHDGMRLVISRDLLPRGSRGIHLAASAEPDSAIYCDVEDGRLSFEKFLRLAERRFAKISGDKRPLHFVGLSHARRLPHWFLSEDGDYAKFEEECEGGGFGVGA